MIAANNGWFIALDNLSGLTTQLSDSLCQTATGAGFSTREMYSDTDEILIDAQRPIILNGIDDIATRHDMIDRAIIINLEQIPKDKRKTEARLWREFNIDKPAILGALLDQVSVALRELPNMKESALSRMADFEVWATAALPPDERETFVKAFNLNRKYSVELGLEGSPVAEALDKLLAKTKHVESTATELLVKLGSYVSDLTRMSKAWPQHPRGLSGEIRRLAPALRSRDITITCTRQSGTGKRLIDIRKTTVTTVTSSQKGANTNANNNLSCDDRCDDKGGCDDSRNGAKSCSSGCDDSCDDSRPR